MTAIRPGAVVACWDGPTLLFGVVAGEQKQRVQLVLARGGEQRVSAARVVVEVAAPGAVPDRSLEQRRDAGARVEAVERRVRELASAVDVPLLWEIASDGGQALDEVPNVDLADLALGSRHGDAQAALILALRADGIHFERRAGGALPRSARAVDELRQQREAEARREREEQELFAALKRVVRDGTFEATDSAAERRYLNALETLAIHEESAPESARTLSQQALRAAGLRHDRPHEGAFRLLRRIGRFDSDDQNLQLLRYRLAPTIPPEVIEAARAAATRGFETSGRNDLTGLNAVSIDSAETREIDDLISVETLGDGWRVGVHIADPAAFVRPGDAVDHEALNRAVSHYMPDVRIYMLPEPIGVDASSLVEGESRPALSFLVELDATGEIRDYALSSSIVRSSGRLDYAAVDRTLEQGTGPFHELLAALVRLSGLRQDCRERRGAILLRPPEVEVHVDPAGLPCLKRLEGDSPSRRAVTEAMILAGEVAADFCGRNGLPVIYRRQSPPASPVELPPGGAADPVTVRATRRTLRRAQVGLEPGPHASLGLSAYTQVTSPLRRYQDLICHRQLLAALRGDPPPYDLDALQRIAATTDQAESDARRAERSADDYWMLRYLERYEGQDLAATVIEIDPRPVIQLDETLREQPMPSLKGVEAGQHVQLRIERVNPRAGLLVLRRTD